MNPHPAGNAGLLGQASAVSTGAAQPPPADSESPES